MFLNGITDFNNLDNTEFIKQKNKNNIIIKERENMIKLYETVW